MDREWKRIGKILLDQGVITQAQLEEALNLQTTDDGFIGEALARIGVDQERIFSVLSQQMGIAFIDVNNIIVDPKIKSLVSKELCVKYTAIPLFVMRDILTLAMTNPMNRQAVDDIQVMSKLKIKPVFATPNAIKGLIEKCFGECSFPQELPSNTHVAGSVERRPVDANIFPQQIGNEALIAAKDDIGCLKEAANLASVIEVVNQLVSAAIEMKASDIHLEPRQNSFNCRYRIDGLLYEMRPLMFELQAAIISRIKIMANLDIAEKRLPQDGKIKMPHKGKEIDLRISTFPTIYGENVVIRILDRSLGFLNVNQLGLSSAVFDDFKKLIRRPYGIILVTGPTGSGKTTTLYAGLSDINTLDKDIVTLEDPVEYEVANIRQSQVNPKAGLTFATGLRSILRQDPDVIMIGEIRDKETADIAIHAALTGHLVFSTLHTNDSAGAFTRLIDMGVEPFLVASSLIGVLAQRLIRTLCPNCKQIFVPDGDLLKQMGLDEKVCGNLEFYREKGCHACNERGYIGRTGIYELMISNDRIVELITHKASANLIREEVVKQGMRTLRADGLDKVKAGITSLTEILRVSEE